MTLLIITLLVFIVTGLTLIHQYDERKKKFLKDLSESDNHLKDVISTCEEIISTCEDIKKLNHKVLIEYEPSGEIG